MIYRYTALSSWSSRGRNGNANSAVAKLGGSSGFFAARESREAVSLLCVLMARLGANWIYETAIEELRASGIVSRWTPNDTDRMCVERIWTLSSPRIELIRTPRARPLEVSRHVAVRALEVATHIF